MKQTSLIQSWTRVLNPSISRQSRSRIGKHQTELAPEAIEDKNFVPGDDTEDRLLVEALDTYTDDHNPPVNPTTSCIDQFRERIRTRLPVNYRPTGNDADHLEGFDIEAGRTWIYPTNGSLRDYQFYITEQCLYKNTLVCLPTGLGKTFIAAVVLHNFMRWYPAGKVVFLAPTRPLVAQQLNACRQLTGLSPKLVVELTGSTPQQKRQHLWTNLRAFFLTPQVLVNDLQANICPSANLRLLVFDEAHKATGNHAYCQVSYL
ncbi:hypothetical protein EG68_08052 [Paragonimus skrjabini miyazakii]|uniref:Helicase ATP-binding domain-containing protein n=1 Tax=Paragonimus skrjabini miyazakii TaxID=59628 RepID=A0A8S9YUT3_9TREM|nr:hypothetical protein EG68_08052 [Paragonimus skrjabini miyazakii]